MRLQLLDVYAEWEYMGFSILTFGWYEHSLLALHFVSEDKHYGAQLTGSVLWKNFHIGGKKKDTLP